MISNDNKSATTSTTSTTSTTTPTFITFQLKSSERQRFDIRLSFQPPAFRAWWPLLPTLAQQVLPADPILSSKLDSVICCNSTHSLELRLERRRAIVGLLTSSGLPSPPPPPPPPPSSAKSTTTAMVLKLPPRCRKRNHLARRRIDLVCSVVESLLRHYGTASIVDGSVFSFDAAEAEAAEAEKTSSSSPSSENRSPPPPSDLQQLNRGDNGVNSSNNNTNDRLVGKKVYCIEI